MFDIGFAELLLIGVVGLLVVGPEQLPGTVRTVLAWVNRFRRSFDQIRTEVRRELHNDEIMQKLKAESQEIEQQVRETHPVGGARTSVADGTRRKRTEHTRCLVPRPYRRTPIRVSSEPEPEQPTPPMHPSIRMSDTTEQNDPPMSLVAHLTELRDRLLRAVLAVLIGFIVLFPFANEIYGFVSAPLRELMPEGSTMIATGVASPFLTPFKLSLVLAIFMAIPVILYQIWGFVAPGLYKKEKRIAIPLLASSVLLFYAGAAFAYFIVFPLIFAFFTSVGPESVQVMTDINSYLDFVLKLFLAFGIAFEMPIAAVILIWTGVTSPDALAKKRPYIIVGCFIFGMLLTPPDVISQSLLAIPMWLLFELGVFFGRLLEPKPRLRADNHRPVGEMNMRLLFSCLLALSAIFALPAMAQVDTDKTVWRPAHTLQTITDLTAAELIALTQQTNRAFHASILSGFEAGKAQTPQQALIALYSAFRLGDPESAALYLDLRYVPESQTLDPTLARGLLFIFAQQNVLDLSQISSDPEGTLEDGLPEDLEKAGAVTLSQEVIPVYLQRIEDPDGTLAWRVANETLVRVPDMWDELGYSDLAVWLSNALPEFYFLGMGNFQFVTLLFTLIAGWFLTGWISLVRLGRRFANPWKHALSRFLRVPSEADSVRRC